MIDGRPHFVKHYRIGDEHRTARIVRARVAQEFDLMRTLANLRVFHGELGTMNIVDVSIEDARIVTEEVPGPALEDCLMAWFRHSSRSSCLRGIETAGRWLAVFQTLDRDVIKRQPITTDSDELLHYCGTRLDTLKSLPQPRIIRRLLPTLLTHLEALITSDSEEGLRTVWSHSDFGPFNIHWDGNTLTPIDFGMSRLAAPLSDVTYFIFHLELIALHVPWRRWPIADWRHAFLRGYGRLDADDAPAYKAWMIRHYLNRIVGLCSPANESLKGQIHRIWLRYACTRRLAQLLKDGSHFLPDVRV